MNKDIILFFIFYVVKNRHNIKNECIKSEISNNYGIDVEVNTVIEIQHVKSDLRFMYNGEENGVTVLYTKFNNNLTITLLDIETGLLETFKYGK